MRGNFDYMQNETVLDIVDQAARRVHRKYEAHSDLEELRQEAFIIVSTAGDAARAIANEDYGYLQHQLEMDLVDLVRKEVRRTEKNVSFEMLRDACSDGSSDETFVRPYVLIETTTNDYSRDSVETLLPAIWDDTYAYGLPNHDHVPDPDMPKSQVDASRGNNLAAYIADIRTGWAKSHLTIKERRALLLAYGLGWTQQEIAYNQDVSQPTIQRRLENAIGKITARLNGGYRYEPAS